MTNYCTNCGTKLRKEDNYCTNCGAKIIKDDVYCTKCGTKLRKEDNYCTNCGTKIDISDIKQNNHLFKSSPDNLEKEKAKKELKKVVGGRLSYNKTFGNELLKNGLDVFYTGKAIRKQVENEINNGQIKSGEVKSRVNQLIIEYKIKKEKEDEKARIDKEKEEKSRLTEEIRSKKIEEKEIINRNYCSLSCKHCYEEFLDSGGGIVGDFDSEGYTEYYCHLGHRISFGSFCKDFE